MWFIVPADAAKKDALKTHKLRHKWKKNIEKKTQILMI